MFGVRHTKRKGEVQRYKCADCRCSFTPTMSPPTSYPLKAIAYALTYYNKGHSYRETQEALKRVQHISVPVQTVQTWTRRHADIAIAAFEAGYAEFG